MKLTENQLRKIVRTMLIEAGGFMGAFRAGRGAQNRRTRPKIKSGYAQVRSSGGSADYDNDGDLGEVDDVSIELEEAGGTAPVRSSGGSADYDNDGDLEEIDDMLIGLEEDEAYESD